MFSNMDATVAKSGFDAVLMRKAFRAGPTTAPLETEKKEGNSRDWFCGGSGQYVHTWSTWATSTMASTATGLDTASLDHCVSLLEAPSDEKRFVGLLLATRLVKGPADLTRVFDACTQFVRRLLLSPAPADAAESGNPYRSLALTVLASFATEETLHARPEFISCMAAAAIPFVRSAAASPSELNDSVTVLRVALLQPAGLAEAVSARLASSVLALAAAAPPGAHQQPEQELRADSGAKASQGSGEAAVGSLSCELLELLAAAAAATAASDAVPTGHLCDELVGATCTLAVALASRRDALTFPRLRVVLALVRATRASVAASNDVLEPALASRLGGALFEGLAALLSSRLPPTARADALQARHGSTAGVAPSQRTALRLIT